MAEVGGDDVGAEPGRQFESLRERLQRMQRETDTDDDTPTTPGTTTPVYRSRRGKYDRSEARKRKSSPYYRSLLLDYSGANIGAFFAQVECGCQEDNHVLRTSVLDSLPRCRLRRPNCDQLR